MKRTALIDAHNSLDHKFHNILRRIMAEKLDAKFDGDKNRLDALIAQETIILKQRRELRRSLDEAVLTTANVDRLVVALKAKAGEAEALLEDLRTLKDTLKTFTKAAKLALDVVTTVTGILS